MRKRSPAYLISSIRSLAYLVSIGQRYVLNVKGLSLRGMRSGVQLATLLDLGTGRQGVSENLLGEHARALH